MRKRLTAFALAGTVGLGAVGVAAYPAFADETTSSSPSPDDAEKQAFVDRRTEGIKEALKGLVDDGTLTQEQADKVASTLGTSRFGFKGGGPGELGRWGGLGMRGGLGIMGDQAEIVAKALGLSVEELQTALREGSTLAELAEKQGKDVDDLVTPLVAAAKERLAEEVTAGRLTQERADELARTLEERVRSAVENGHLGMHGMKGHGPRGHWGQERGGGQDGAVPSQPPGTSEGTPSPGGSAPQTSPSSPTTPTPSTTAPSSSGGTADSSTFTLA